MNTKKGIKILIYTVLLICTVLLYSNTTSNAKYRTEGSLSYGVNYKKMTADLGSVKISTISETHQNFIHKLTFDRSGNSRNGEKDEYTFEISNDNLDCSITSISDNTGKTSESVNSITFDQVGTEKISVVISCDVPSNLNEDEDLDYEVSVIENIYYTDNDKLTYNYLTSSYSINAGDYYERTFLKGIDPDNPKVYYMDKDEIDKKEYLERWLKEYAKSEGVKVSAAYITNYINSYGLDDSTINESMAVNGIKVESVDDKYKFTITDNFDNYVSTYRFSSSDPMRFYFYEKNDTNNDLFFEYLEKYYKPLVDNNKYDEVVNYIKSKLNGDNIVDSMVAGNRLGITYSPTKEYLSIPKNIYDNLTTDFVKLEFDEAPTRATLLDNTNGLRKYTFIHNSLLTKITSSSGYILNCINGTDYDNYSYYSAGTESVLVHVYYDKTTSKHIYEVTVIEGNEFKLTYDASVTDIDTLIANDVNSIKQNLGSDYTVGTSAITVNEEGKKEITVTLTKNA